MVDEDGVAVAPKTIRSSSGFVRVPCPGCGDARTISSRQSRRKVGLCLTCRNPARIVVTDEHRAYWTDRFPLEDIVGLAEAIFGGHSPLAILAAAPKEEET